MSHVGCMMYDLWCMSYNVRCMSYDAVYKMYGGRCLLRMMMMKDDALWIMYGDDDYVR